MIITREKEILNRNEVPFEDIVNKASLIQEHCSDYEISSVTPDTFRVNEDGTIFFKSDNKESKRVDISSYALAQTSQKVGLSSGFMEDCFDRNLGWLAALSANTYLSQKPPKGLFVRTYEENGNEYIRATLSKKYADLPAVDALHILGDAINTDDYKCVSTYIDDERCHLRLVSKNMLKIFGEDLFPMILFDTSDIGRCSLSVRFGIYKQVCTNGLVMMRFGGNLFTQKHMGISNEEFYDEMVAKASLIPTLITKSEEVIKNTMTKAVTFEEIIKECTMLGIKRDTEVVQGLMNTKYTGLNRWSLINAITDVSQNYTLDKRLDLEQKASMLLVA